MSGLRHNRLRLGNPTPGNDVRDYTRVPLRRPKGSHCISERACRLSLEEIGAMAMNISTSGAGNSPAEDGKTFSSTTSRRLPVSFQ